MGAKIIVGLGYGDEGKGISTYHFAKKDNAKWVIRYNGGSQCGHNIINENGYHHNCSQFGAGVLNGCNTFLSKYVKVSLIPLLNEADGLKKFNSNIKELLKTVYIDSEAPMITLYHIIINRIKNNINKHGSCGHGIGELGSDIENKKDIITIGDVYNDNNIIERLENIRISKLKHILYKYPEEIENIKNDPLYSKLLEEKTSRDLYEIYRLVIEHVNVIFDSNNFINEQIAPHNIVFEGAQGVLLHEYHGFHPHTTWSDTSPKNAVQFLKDIDYKDPYEIIGITRPYLTKHGNGPFKEIYYPREPKYYNEHNCFNKYQLHFKYGYLDTVLLNYSIKVCEENGGFDSIFLTHCDGIDSAPSRYVITHWMIDKNSKIDKLKYKKPSTTAGIRRTNMYSRSEQRISLGCSVRYILNNYNVKYFSNGPAIGQQNTIDKLIL